MHMYGTVVIKEPSGVMRHAAHILTLSCSLYQVLDHASQVKYAIGHINGGICLNRPLQFSQTICISFQEHRQTIDF